MSVGCVSIVCYWWQQTMWFLPLNKLVNQGLRLAMSLAQGNNDNRGFLAATKCTLASPWPSSAANVVSVLQW